MKINLVLRVAAFSTLAFGDAAYAQWSPDPAANLTIAGRHDNDQVQPKVLALPNDQFYLSWFDLNPNGVPPAGYNVLLQRLGAGGFKKIPGYGSLVADLSNSSTEDYGLGYSTAGDALLAFQDTREGANLQITAASVGPGGQQLWGVKGVQLTSDDNFNAAPKIVGTTDGDAVVAWISNSSVVVQKLDKTGKPVWAAPLVFAQSGYNYSLADLHASDDGSVIVSWASAQGFGSDSQLRANKISAAGKLLWGTGNVVIFDQGSLQFGNFPYFITDSAGGAIFAWYTSSPALQVFTQHINATGKEVLAHNGVAVSTNTSNVRVAPSVSYNPRSQEIFMFWTEEDSQQIFNGVYGQKIGPKGTRAWGPNGLVVVPIGASVEDFVTTTSFGGNALVMWVDSPGVGLDTIQGALLDGAGYQTCPQFPISTAPASKYGLSAAVASTGLTALTWADNRSGNNDIYVQNVNPDCSLGK